MDGQRQESEYFSPARCQGGSPDQYAVLGDQPATLGQFSGPHQHFGRDAAPVRAFAADEICLDPNHVEAGSANCSVRGCPSW